MSTRATYEINGQTFYCHCDGYHAGAAAKFAKMIGALHVPEKSGAGGDAIEQRRGGACFAFIRGNMDAEPTESHDVHGDTEHRYRITVDALGRIMLQTSKRTGAEGYHWTAWSEGEPIAAFINRHYPGAVVVIESPDRYWKRELLATTERALGIAQAHRRAAAGYGDDNPNKARHVEHADAWERALIEQIPARVRYLEKVRVETAEAIAKRPTFGRCYYERELEEATRELEALRVPIGESVAA